jgi:hypothetical protein
MELGSWFKHSNVSVINKVSYCVDDLPCEISGPYTMVNVLIWLIAHRQTARIRGGIEIPPL